MQMIDVLKRLAELDASNPNVVNDKKQDVAESIEQSVEECGMMGGMDRPSTPASINMTAATGEELSGMLKDIMTLAGMSKEEPISTPALSVVEPASDGMGPPDQVDFMRSTLDKLNPTDDDSEDDEERKVDEYDNEPNPQGTDYSSMTPTGDDLASKGGEAPKVNGGGNPMQRTVEEIEQQLLSDYQKFMNEGN